MGLLPWFRGTDGGLCGGHRLWRARPKHRPWLVVPAPARAAAGSPQPAHPPAPGLVFIHSSPGTLALVITTGYIYIYISRLRLSRRYPVCLSLKLTKPVKLLQPSLLHVFCFLFLSFCLFLEPLSRHMEVPRPGIQSELKPPAYTRATATPDPSRVCDPNHSSRQRWIFNPLTKARDRTRNLMVPSRIR